MSKIENLKNALIKYRDKVISKSRDYANTCEDALFESLIEIKEEEGVKGLDAEMRLLAAELTEAIDKANEEFEHYMTEEDSFQRQHAAGRI